MSHLHYSGKRKRLIVVKGCKDVVVGNDRKEGNLK